MLAAILLAVVQGARGQAPECGCLDVVFVVDDTGSMGGAIASVRSNLGNIIDTAMAVSGGDLKMGLVTFKDDVQVDCPLTANLAKVESAVMGLSASGGGDGPEASTEALQLVIDGMTSDFRCAAAAGSVGEFRGECIKWIIFVTDQIAGACQGPGRAPSFPSPSSIADSAVAKDIVINALQVSSASSVEAQLKTYTDATGGIFGNVGSGSTISTVIVEILESCTAPPTGSPTLATPEPTAAP